MSGLLLTLLLACGGDTTPSSATDSDDTTTAPTDSGSTDTALACPPADTAGDGTIDAACCDTASTLQLLGGEGWPEDLEEGGDLYIAYSPQYGWELQLFPKICGTRNQVSLTVVLTDVETGSVLQEETEPAILYPDAEGSCCQDAWLRYERLDVREIPDHEGRDLAEALCDRPVTLAITATDWDGRTATESLGLTVRANEEAMGHPCGEERSGTKRD